MRKWTVGLLGLTLAAGAGVVAVTPPALAAPPGDGTSTAEAAPATDDLSTVQEAKRRQAREDAIQQLVSGQLSSQQRGDSTVAKVGTKAVPGKGSGSKATRVDQYVELSRQKTDKIFVVLVEFGNQRHPSYPDQDTSATYPGPTVFDGPLHNQIPQPDRTVDNSTLWRSDFSQQYFQNLYFGTGTNVESVKSYYERQSSGRYSIDGMVTDWVKVPYNEARYGRSNGYPCTSSICSNVWYLLGDAIGVWVQQQYAQGRTDAQIAADLAAYDQWDRNDYDGDGDFNEPDGYIDHFQIVHAGGDQADMDPYQGEDAIWSHRWNAYSNNIGKTGPDNNKWGGLQIGNTGLWISDYTIQPENGGIDVFAHEYGHDLGLPDHYDTTGPSANSENPVGWWTLMSQSRVSAPGDNSVGGRAADLSAWDKLQLGWLNYQTVIAGSRTTVDLGPHEYNSGKPQAALVVLPKKQVTTAYPTPPEGSRQWWSGQGNNLNNTLSRQVTIPAGNPATLTFQANWDIEDCGLDPCDYAYLEVDSGSGYTPVPGNITRADEGDGIDGTSGSWQAASFDLSAYAGQTIGLRLRYITDAAAGGLGLFVDQIALTSGTTELFSDGAEADGSGWTAAGFSRVADRVITEYDNYYIVSNRTWVSYDRYLQWGPYNYGNTSNTKLAEHFGYQEGLLISYWDTSQANNNTSQHHGEGKILPIDAHPQLLIRSDGQPWRPRVQGYDAAFSTRRTQGYTLTYAGTSSRLASQAGVSVFDDSRQYYYENPTAGVYYGVKVPKNGVRIQVIAQSGTSMRIKVS